MNRIVVGVDPNPAGGDALDWALREAVAVGGSLQAIRAWTLSAQSTEAFAYTADAVIPGEAAAAQLVADEQLKLAVDRVPGADAVPSTATAIFGAPSDVLVQHAQDSLMLVVGSRGRAALSRAVLGSVSSSVLHHVTCPVTVVPELRAVDGASPRVLVGVDHSAPSLVALSVAADQARRRGAVLIPVFVHEPFEVPRGGAHAPDLALLEATERSALESAAVAAGAVQVQAEVLVGQTAACLLEAARPQDLVVLGSRGRGGFSGLLLGSTSTQVVQHATCPVLVVRA